MTYLKQPRVLILLLCFATSSLLLNLFPGIDLRVSSSFSRGNGFPLAGQWWATLLHESVGYSICLSLVSTVALYAFNRCSRRRVWGVGGKTVAYLFLVLVLGAGLIVNLALKNNFGRARPRNVTQFGGLRQFTPAFAAAEQCDTNCSFASGDGAGAFFFLALALASRRRAALVVAIGFGGLVSFSRIAAGAHFLSDTVVSLFVMWIVADVLYFYMLLPEHGPLRASATRGRSLDLGIRDDLSDGSPLRAP